MLHYYEQIAAAFVLGKYSSQLPEKFKNRKYYELGDDDIDFLINYGRKYFENFFIFKRALVLPRIKTVLSYLHSIEFKNMLDIGSGRGAFLFPFMDEFPGIEITVAELDKEKADVFNCMELGGLNTINGLQQDVTNLKFKDQSFDVVAALEVLEHIPNSKQAFNEIVRVAEKHIFISVPSKQDGNPEHLHLLTKDIFKSWITGDNSLTYKFKEVKDHLIVIINK